MAIVIIVYLVGIILKLLNGSTALEAFLWPIILGKLVVDHIKGELR
jgi:hypothetical protein